MHVEKNDGLVRKDLDEDRRETNVSECSAVRTQWEDAKWFVFFLAASMTCASSWPRAGTHLTAVTTMDPSCAEPPGNSH